jgi:hypothetical protein|nr:MAG TPA: hypothetical protein [Caudoviricetes sp.]
MVTEAKTANYWISNSALYIQLNATGEPNRIQASVVSGASILCYMQGIDGLGYDAGHNYQRWTLAAYPSEFPSDERRYLYVAIPRPKKTDSPDGTIRQRNLDDVALVVFPSERIDIYGKSITDESKQVGSEDYYYIYLQGIISEVQITKDNVRYRAWVNPQPFDYGSLATDEALDSGGVRQWWQYNSIDDTISFLKTIANATFSFLKITQGLLFGDKDKITGIAKDNTSDTSDELIVTPSFLGQFGVRHFLSKTDDDTAHGLITFEKGIRFGVQKVADALNEVWDITEAGIAHLSQLFVKGNVQIGEKDKPVEVNFGNYSAGSTGAQVAVKDDGTSLAEFDYITIRRAADFRSITIHELRYIGGELAITPAAMQVSKVERLGTDGNVVADDVEPDKFKCYFDTSDSKGEKKVYNEFVVGDQARCQQFGIDAGTHEFVKTKYYWRLVVEVGENYIVLSNTDKDKLTTSEPSVNDNIVQLGYRYEGQDNRQAAIILSATANDAPSQKFYQGINDYSLDHVVKDEGYDVATGLFHCNIYGDSYTGDKEGKSFFQYDSKKKEATFKGKMIFNSDSLLPDNSPVTDIVKKDDLKDLNIKSGNLLRNTSFCGDYESIDISEETEISEDKETFSEKLKYWTMENASVIDTKDSTSGKAVRIGGTLSQQLAQPLLVDKAYVLSFKGKGTSVKVSIGGETHDVDMTSSFERYELHITCSDAADDVFSMVSTNCVVCEIMLSYGKLAPAWSPSYSDNDKSMAEFQNMKFLTDAITQGSTTIDGGLVMSQQFKVGNFRDKKMIKETGGMSGYYNDDDSPFLWGGGTLEQAIYTIQKYKDNPNYEPTAEELNNLAKFVVTHGGRAILTDIILRGIIYAEGGVMKSVKSPNGNFEIDEEGNAKFKGDSEFGGKLVGVSGSFKRLNCVNNKGNVVGSIEFGSDGRMWFDGDMFSQGYNKKEDRSNRFYTSDVWCRGMFGHRSKTMAIVKQDLMKVFTRGTGKEPVEHKLTQGMTTSSNTYYEIPLFAPGGNDDTAGMPIDVILFNNTADYYYSFVGMDDGKEWRVINGNDHQTIHFCDIGGWHELKGGASVNCIYIPPEFLTPVPSSSSIGRGVFWTGETDMNWDGNGK